MAKKIIGRPSSCALGLTLVCMTFGIAISCTPRPRLDRVSVRMKWIFNGTVSEFFYGDAKGYFRDEGIALSIQPGGPGISGVNLVASHASTFAVTSPEEIIRARANGVPVKAIAVVFQKNPVRFLASGRSGIRGPEDLAGKTVALVLGDNTELQFEQMLESAGLRRDQLNIVPWTFDLRQLISGKIDLIPAYDFDQPLQLRRLDPNFVFETINPDQHKIDAFGDVLITSDSVIQERSELVIRFVRAFLRSLDAARMNQTEAVEKLVSQNPDLDMEKELATWSRATDYLATGNGELGVMDNEKWRATLERLVRYQEFELPAGFDLSTCYTNSFVQQAQQ